MQDHELQVDFAALKKEMPAHAAILDSLQKQYEALKIPYGEVPAEFAKVDMKRRRWLHRDELQEVEKWSEYNNARIQFHEQKVADGLEEAKKVEEKWAKAPPVEHFNRQHFAEYFPQEFYDLRYQNRSEFKCTDDTAMNKIIYTFEFDSISSLPTYVEPTLLKFAFWKHI